MELINAFKHPESGRIFETKEQYDKHLVTYEARMARKRENDEKVTNFNKSIHFPRKNSKTIKELLENIKNLVNAYNNDDKIASIDCTTKQINVMFAKLRYLESLNKDNNSGYIKFEVDIKLKSSNEKANAGKLTVRNPFSSIMQEIPGVHVESSSSILIFLSDFPQLYESVSELFKEKERLAKHSFDYATNKGNHEKNVAAYSQNHDSSKEILAIIEDLKKQKERIETSIQIQEKVYVANYNKLVFEFNEAHPFDYSAIDKIKIKQTEVMDQINETLNKGK